MKLYWQIAYRNLFRNARRNLLTGTSIACGLIGMSLLSAYIMRMERYLVMQSVFLSGNGHVVVYAKNGLDKHISEPAKYSLSKEAVDALRAFTSSDPRIEKGAPSLRVGGLVYNGCQSFPFLGTAMEPDMIAWARSRPGVMDFVPELNKFSKGQAFWTMPPEEQAISLSPRLALILGKDKVFGETGAAASPIDIDCRSPASKAAIRLDPGVQLLGAAFESGVALADATIAGHLSTGMAFQDDTAIQMPFMLAQTMYQTDKATAFSFFLKDELEIPGFLKDLDSFLKSKSIEADAFPFFDEKISPFYVGGMQFNIIMLYMFIVFVCSVAAISISNSLYISLMERKAELGTLRSLGFKQAQVRMLLILESLCLLVFSILPGVLMTYAIRTALHATNIRIQIPGLASNVQFKVFLTPGNVTLMASILAILVLAVTFIGATKFLKRPILDLLGTSSC